MRAIKMFMVFIMLFTLLSCKNDEKVKFEDGNLIISEGVEEIDNCPHLNEEVCYIYLPKSLKRVGNSAFFDLGMEFKGVYYSGELEDWVEIEFGELYSNPMEHGCYDELEFYYTENNEYKPLTDIRLKEGVRKINNYAFSGFTANDVILPKSLEELGKSSFQGATIKGNIIIPEDGSLKAIGDACFEHMNYSNDLRLPNTLEYIGRNALIIINNGTNLYIPYLASLSIDIPFVSFIGAYNYKHIHLTKGKEIGLLVDKAFWGSISFPDETEVILPKALHNTYLEMVYFSPNSRLKKIEDEAFSMTIIDLMFFSAGLMEIDNDAFKGASVRSGFLSYARNSDSLMVKSVNMGNYFNEVLINDYKSGWDIIDNRLYIYGKLFS